MVECNLKILYNINNSKLCPSIHPPAFLAASDALFPDD